MTLTPPSLATTASSRNAGQAGPEPLPAAERGDPVSEPGGGDFFKTNPNSEPKAEMPEDKNNE